MNVLRTMNSLRISFWMVPDNFSGLTPCSSAATMYLHGVVQSAITHQPYHTKLHYSRLFLWFVCVYPWLSWGVQHIARPPRDETRGNRRSHAHCKHRKHGSVHSHGDRHFLQWNAIEQHLRTPPSPSINSDVMSCPELGCGASVPFENDASA